MCTFLDCYPFFLRQGLDTARHAGADEDLQEIIMQKSLRLAEAHPASRPPEISARIHRMAHA